jgi:hypothetical protein
VTVDRFIPHVDYRQLVHAKSSRLGSRPSLIVVHATQSPEHLGIADLKGTGAWFDRKGSEESSHVCTDGEGHSARFVRDEDKAWHVASYNRVSLGIEQIGFAEFQRWQEAELRETARWTELAKSGHASIDLISGDNFERVERVATGLAQSGVFKDVSSTQNAMAKILLGADLGLTPTQALMNIDVVEGNARVRSNQLAAWVRQHPDYDYRVVEHDAEHCVIEFTYKGEIAGTSAFSMVDARAPGWSRSTRRRRGTRTRGTCCSPGR